MFTPIARNKVRKRVHERIRKGLAGTDERPRLNVFRSLQHVYAQVVDDTRGSTLVAASSLDKDFPLPGGGNVAAAREVGKLIAQRSLEKGIRQVAFDRGGYRYHGRVKALADAAREAGLQF
ncbi:MAG: 50S ribosomal protein L18 [Acidobacteria bacterium RIFCSPLOWO2_02_FULL_61_28]|nr:MAG: 50S ribosomal protein L18 [Acidobacteria bacterium RIFCSPLOWO2_02_FULL_61_28]